MAKTDLALQAFQKSYQQYVKSTQWTSDGVRAGVRLAVLGRIVDGDVTPPKVVVEAELAYWPGAVYVHYTDIETKEATQALLHPNSLIPFTDDVAGMTVEVGYPPNEARPFVRGQSSFTLHETQNLSVHEQRTLQSELITLDRMAPLLLVAIGGLMVQVNQGYWRYNNLPLVQDAVSVDLTDYVPTTPDKAIWLILALYATGGIYIGEGAEFDVELIDDDQTLFIPTSVPSATLLLGWVQLYEGMTDLTYQGQVIPVAFAPAVYDSVVNMEDVVINNYGGFNRWTDGSFVRWSY